MKNNESINMTEIPPGYRKDGKGNLVAEANIKEIDKLRDELVLKVVQRGKEMADRVAEFKQQALREILAFCDLSSMEYGAPLGGTKGNVTLHSFDGQYKLLKAIDDRLQFDERLNTAKTLIDECIEEWTRDSNVNIKAIVNQAFEVNKQGEISTSRVLGLRRINIDDERWARAMDAIADSVTVIGSKTYIRLYERDDESGKYRQISINGSGG